MFEPLLAGIFQRVAAMPIVELLLWCGLATLSIVLLVLLRTGWGQARPLRKCALLSLLVHLLLACVAMTVRIVVGDGGVASGPPIRVRIVQEAELFPAARPVAVAEPLEMVPPLLEASPGEPVEEVNDSQADAIATETEPPPLAEAQATPPVEPTPSSEPASVAPSLSETAEASKPAHTQEASSDSPLAGASPDRVDESAEPTQSAGTATPTPVPAAYALRNHADRLSIVQSQGGNRRTEEAVAAALRWLAAAQSPDGRWDASRFGAGRELAVLGHHRNGAGRGADTGISALALLAFLGAGHTHEHGSYQLTIQRGLDFLLRSQAADGNLFGDATLYAQMYCHAMATFALAEALAITGDQRLEPSVARAVGFSLRAQHAAGGGWRYRVGDSGDTSLLGWKVMALASAERAGLSVPPQTWTGVELFLRSVRRGGHGGLASYRPDGPASTPMTAEASYCWLLLAEMTGAAVDDAAATEAMAQLLASLPQTESVNLYYWYYATLALHHRQTVSDRARAAWHTWNNALTSVLLESQLADGPDAGSWPPSCIWGGYGGRVYSTALGALCLEVYYRYAPMPQRDPWMATRQDAAAAPR